MIKDDNCPEYTMDRDIAVVIEGAGWGYATPKVFDNLILPCNFGIYNRT